MLKLVVGLGNPGKQYQNTRHNLGFLFVDFFQKHFPNIPTLKPQDFMNNSGQSVAKQVSFFKLNPDTLLVAHDDLDLALGEWKLQFNRGSAGHNGVKSIISHLNSQGFWRLRLGIGRPEDAHISPENYVLMKFSNKDSSIIAQVFEDVLNSSDFQKLLGP